MESEIIDNNNFYQACLSDCSLFPDITLDEDPSASTPSLIAYSDLDLLNPLCNSPDDQSIRQQEQHQPTFATMKTTSFIVENNLDNDANRMDQVFAETTSYDAAADDLQVLGMSYHQYYSLMQQHQEQCQLLPPETFSSEFDPIQLHTSNYLQNQVDDHKCLELFDGVLVNKNTHSNTTFNLMMMNLVEPTTAMDDQPSDDMHNKQQLLLEVEGNRGSGSDHKRRKSRTRSASSSLDFAALANSNKRQPTRRRRKQCEHCGTSKAPAWRKGLDGRETLCNACGLYVKLHGKPREMYVEDGVTKVKRNPKPTKVPCFRCGKTFWSVQPSGESSLEGQEGVNGWVDQEQVTCPRCLGGDLGFDNNNTEEDDMVVDVDDTDILTTYIC